MSDNVSTIELMRVTSADELENLHPDVRCKKCGKKQWLRDSTPLTWTCLGCGNYVSLKLGRPVQQIEVLMRSTRGNDFKYTKRGTVVPDSWEDED